MILNHNHIQKHKPTQFLLGMIVIIVISFAARVVLIHNFPWGYDEGIHVLLARLLEMGYQPYRELFVSYPPMFVWSLDASWRIGHSVEALQMMMVLYSLIGVVSVGYIAYRLNGVLAGLLGAIFLSFAPMYLDGSRAVMTEVPSVGVGVLSVALLCQYYWSGRRGWLFASGLVLTASLMLKILSPFLLGLAPAMILGYRFINQSADGKQINFNRYNLRQSILDGLVWAAGLLLPVLFILVLYDYHAMYKQVIAFRFDSRVAFDDDWGENFGLLFSFLRQNSILTVMSIIGILTGFRTHWRKMWFLVLWLLLAIAFVLIQVPLREKHLPLLLPPIAVFAAIGFDVSIQYVLEHLRVASAIRAAGLAIIGLAFLGYALPVGWSLARQQNTEYLPSRQANQQLLAFTQKFTAPTDCIISDDPTLIFFSGRYTPPQLSEVSSARLRSGYLITEMLIKADDEFECQMVVPVARRLKRSTPDFIEWAKQNYRGLWLYDGETEILLAKPLTHATPESPVTANFAGKVALTGYDLTPVEDGVAYLSLYWKVLQPIEENYTVFVHVRDAANETRINADHQPYDGRVPTSQWHVGDIIKETIQIPVTPETPSGEYKIFVGMYLQHNNEFPRLSLTNDTSGENAVIISGFVIP